MTSLRHDAAPPDPGKADPREADPSGGERRPCVLAATLLALAAACLTFFGAAALIWRSQAATLGAIDFNAALFEDFLGPYWQTAKALVEGGAAPAPGYLYPSTLAWLLAPFAAFAPAEGAFAASIVALWLVGGSMALWIGSVFALQRPRSMGACVLAGVAFGLAHAPVHGAYWAQASLPALALLGAGVAFMTSGRPRLAGFSIGLGAALKLYPAVGLLALVVPWRGRDSRRGALSAVAAAAASGVLLPIALMGRAAFVDFHRASFAALRDIHAWVLTEEGGRGAQDFPTVLRRATGLDSAWLSGTLGWLFASALAAAAVLVLQRGRAPLIGLVLLAAIPWAAVSPTWPHGLLWVPAAWWCALQHPSKLGWAFAVLSFACGSILALSAFSTPQSYTWYGLPAWSAAFALAALVPAGKAAVR